METLKRRSPKNGYDNEQKNIYRHDVWEILSKECKRALMDSRAKVLMLPSKEGIEIDVAISYGIEPNQIIAIDENPALIAVSDWRKKHPEVKYFGCKVSEVHKKIKQKNWYLAAANLDFCNNFSTELIHEVNTFLKYVPRTKDFSFFVTFGKGREGSALLMLLKELEAPDCFEHGRSAALYHMIKETGGSPKGCLSLLCEKQYISSRVPMIYIGFKFNHSRVLSGLNIHWEERKKEIKRMGWINELYGTKTDYEYKSKWKQVYQAQKSIMESTGLRQKKECERLKEKHSIISNSFCKWYLGLLQRKCNVAAYSLATLDEKIEELFNI